MMGQCGGDGGSRCACNGEITIDLGSMTYALLAIIKKIGKTALIDCNRTDALYLDVADVPSFRLTSMPGRTSCLAPSSEFPAVLIRERL